MFYVKLLKSNTGSQIHLINRSDRYFSSAIYDTHGTRQNLLRQLFIFMTFHTLFHDFSWPRPDYRTFQAWKMWTLNSTNFHSSRTEWTHEKSHHRENAPVCRHSVHIRVFQGAFGPAAGTLRYIMPRAYCPGFVKMSWFFTFLQFLLEQLSFDVHT